MPSKHLLHVYENFEKLMLSAWIRIFEPENEIAVHITKQWAWIS